jgi:DNA-binding transcriptional ArsR family regulator
MDKSFVLKSQRHYKAFSHPLRLAILKLLNETPRTNEELARALNVASGKLYFHTKTLLDAGMIELLETRQKGHLTEKVYRATAQKFVAEPTLDGSQPPLEALLTGGLDLYRASWNPDQNIHELGGHMVLHHTPERYEAFQRLIRDLFLAFKNTAVDSSTPNAKTLAISLLLHEIPIEKNKEKEKNQ